MPALTAQEASDAQEAEAQPAPANCTSAKAEEENRGPAPEAAEPRLPAAITTPLPPESPAARWKPVPLTDDDWEEIQKMLAKGRTREAIAGDFDVPVEDLDRFIAERLELAKARRAEKETPSGEARAPLH